MSEGKCAKWRCENPSVDGYPYCVDHPPLVDHGIRPNTVECPECGHEGAGTIHHDLWYCDDIRSDGCGELFDPWDVSDVDRDTVWVPGEHP